MVGLFLGVVEAADGSFCTLSLPLSFSLPLKNIFSRKDNIMLAGKDVDKGDPLYSVNGMVNLKSRHGISMVCVVKLPYDAVVLSVLLQQCD